jgi:redox-sensitive bicupin YhaK (pirin superfamily)
MSWQDCENPVPDATSSAAVAMRISPSVRDLGGFQVRRVLPALQRRMLGPFVSWDFVSSNMERLEQAKADWTAGRFAPVPGETEFNPLPA